MSTYNPRIVAQALEDLESEIVRWSSMASDTLTTAMNAQQQADEFLDRALHYAAIVLNRVKGDEERVEKAVGLVALAFEKCSTAAKIAQNTLNEAHAVLTEANTTLQKWQMELEKAMSWFARAEARFEKALLELESAQSVLRSAIMNLNNAESRLKDCQYKIYRLDCRSEAAAVVKARAEVTHAHKSIKRIEQEVNAAKKDFERAKTRIACCKRAIAFSTEAVNVSQESVLTATQAVNFAERGVESAHAVAKLANMAQEKMLVEVETAENMMADTIKAQEFNHDAKMHLQRADSAENRAQTYSTAVQTELRYRIQHLLDLNPPVILKNSDGPSPKNVKVYPRLEREKQSEYNGKRGRPGQNVGEQGHIAIDQSRDINDVRIQSIKKDTGQ